MGILVISVAGNVGRDGELRATPTGESVLNFSVAATTKIKGEEVTTWVRCAMWGKRAEALAPYIKKGTKVYVSGEGQLRDFTNKNGELSTSLDINVAHLALMGDKGSSASEPIQEAPRAKPVAKPAVKKPISKDFESDDDTPF